MIEQMSAALHVLGIDPSLRHAMLETGKFKRQQGFPFAQPYSSNLPAGFLVDDH
jgi:hypothetical protein